MQELLGRISALDPQASLSLRVIACFDELVIGNVNTRALLSAAASLSGCIAGFHQDRPCRTMRVTPKGGLCTGAHGGVDETAVPDDAHDASDGLSVWLERTGPAHTNDAIILERLALAVRIRHGRGRGGLDNRRDLGLLLDPTVEVDDRRSAATRLGLAATLTYRVVVAPLFAVWTDHPTGPQDVVPTPFGPIHALVVAHDHPAVDASPAGTGIAAAPEQLHRSFRTALVALRLCTPPEQPTVHADAYGGLIAMLADLPPDTELPEVTLLDQVMTHTWGPATVEAVVGAGSVRRAARDAGVHHSTMATRLDILTQILGFDPFDGLGRSRLGLAYLVWRLRHSRVLDLPPPTTSTR